MKKRQRQDIIIQFLKRKDEESAVPVSTVYEYLLSQGYTGSDRTVRRDIEELSNDTGLVSTEDSPERYYISKEYNFIHNLELNEESLQTVLIALNSLKKTSHEYFEASATQAENAIYSALAPDIEASLRQAKERYYFDYSMAGRPTKNNNRDFQKIMHAIRESYIIQCKNDSPYKTKEENSRERVFAPYRFVLAAGIPYLIVKDVESDELKTLRACRVTGVKITKDKFDSKEADSLDLKNFIGGWGAHEKDSVEIEIVCERSMGKYFEEKKVHPSQEVQIQKDGNYRIQLSCALSSEITRLVASFGGQLISAAPKQLFDEIKDVWSSGLKKVA